VNAVTTVSFAVFTRRAGPSSAELMMAGQNMPGRIEYAGAAAL
jgi:hypothetical protein